MDCSCSLCQLFACPQAPSLANFAPMRREELPNMTQPVPRRPSCSAQFLAMTLDVFPTDFFLPASTPLGDRPARPGSTKGPFYYILKPQAKGERASTYSSGKYRTDCLASLESCTRSTTAWLSLEGCRRHTHTAFGLLYCIARPPSIGVCQVLLPTRRVQVRGLGRTRIRLDT